MVIFGTGIYLPSFMDAFQKSILSASGQADVIDYAQNWRILLRAMAEQGQSGQRIAVSAGSLERVVNPSAELFTARTRRSRRCHWSGIDPTIAPYLHDYRITQRSLFETGRWQRRRDFGTARRFAWA